MFSRKKLIFILFVIFILIKTELVIAQNNTVLYLSFDEGNGNVVFDSSGYGNDGTVYEATWETENCVSGSCLVFSP